MKPVAIALLITLLGVSSALAAPVSHASDVAPAGLTGPLEDVPSLVPVSVQAPYELAWEQRVQTFQLSFETKIQAQASAVGIDPVVTGSISAAR
jgi:hypothetical protein